MKKLFKKISIINMTFVMIFYSIFSLFVFPEKADAAIQNGFICSKYVDQNGASGVINTTSNLRKGAGTNYSTITTLSKNSQVTILNGTPVEGTGCANGWINVSYNADELYERPWTSPKRAIVGGAKYIARQFVQRGQNTSYLKKFNVNPNSKSGLYNNQYMMNLAAPSSEAKKAYNAYSSNNLLSLSLEFIIPVFPDMQDVYNRPGGNLIDIERKYDVTDVNFENALNNEGFPETYKQPLRVLHDRHPNWSFKAMHTESFNVAVFNEKLVSSIQGNNAYYAVENGQYIQTEPGWYMANDATVAYYLDPRNFLTEKYILQFESLEYSDNYNETAVQSVIKDTFMAGVSEKDNQSYASIFVEAGRTSNLNPVYLSSLAVQESGSKMGSNTSGAQFEYQGITYSGLYNFFNIGASSSASNPSKAGLVWASGGYCTICGNGSYIEPTNDGGSQQPTSQTLSAMISNAGYNISSNYVTGININTPVDSIRERLAGANITSSTDLVGTGTVIEYNGESYTVVITGDLNGDGKINSADLLRMRQHLLGSSTLNGANFESARLAGNANINSADLLKLRQILLS